MFKYEKKKKINSEQLLWISVGKNGFSSKKMLPSFLKDVLPAHQQNNIVYEYFMSLW